MRPTTALSNTADTGLPPRWYKADREAKDQAERSAHLAEAKYYLHRTEHNKGDSEPQGFVRNFNIVMRNGRLKP
jgi:hypothetical protein